MLDDLITRLRNLGAARHTDLTVATEAADEIERMREVLEGVEWHQPTSNSNPSCPYCGAMQHWGHRDDCALAALVKGEGNE